MNTLLMRVLAYAKTQKSLLIRGLLNPSALSIASIFLHWSPKNRALHGSINNLKKHPQFPVLGLRKFTISTSKGISTKPLEYYSQYFDFKNKRTICGDITPSYSLLSEDRLKFIQKLVPDAKICDALKESGRACFGRLL